jgi:CHAT domain-containing protein
VALEREMDRPNSLGAALTALGYCRLELSQTSEARQAFAEAISITEKLRAQAGGGVEESQRFLEGKLRAYHGMLSLLVKENQSDEALAIAELTKARVLLDVLENGRVNIQKAMTTDEREQERRLKSALTAINRRLAGASQSDKPDTPWINELKQEVEKARLDYEAHQVSLYAAHPELKVQRGQGPIITSQELLSLLPDTSTALLEYVVTDEKTYLFAITRADIHLYTLPIKSFELAWEIEAFRQQLAARDLGFRAAAAKLYALLIKPAQAELKGKSNLVIVPDGSLWDLSFQALLSAPNRFLIEDATIAYAPSLTVLREMIERRQQHKASTTILAIGNPAISAKSIERAGMALRDEKIPPLPAQEREVTALGQLYGASRSKIYVGPNAREGRIKIEAENAGILHFATHGILNNIAPMYSHLLLTHGSQDEDGLLEAWELMQLNLRAELVVLSACETARGRYGAGEGVIGLTWALFVAGVPTTVVSQWKVEAASTRDLMVSFHRPLASGAKTTRAEALRQAQLRLRRKPETRHPFYWAGFVLVGDGL